jgi:fatty acid desaturase
MQIVIKRTFEVTMEKQKSQESIEKNQTEKESKSNSIALLAYAIVVFALLAVGLLVILMRSNQGS